MPAFADLYAEHLVAPFFVFQVLCLLLWSLDDYWYYSLFTLFMLMFFEGVLCRQRQQSLLMLRQMRRPPYELFAYRMGQWNIISSDEIVPGDVLSLTASDPVSGKEQQRSRQERDDGDEEAYNYSNAEEHYVPCDALLVRGCCIINEAMLTGESVPQLKESLNFADDKEKGVVELGIESTVDAIWKRHTLFGGTVLLQHKEEEQVPPSPISNINTIVVPSPPDNGCVAVAIRTAFGTSQGGLMRKILFATERVNVNSHETIMFIGVLVVFALVASAAVLHWGLQDLDRNRFKLVLHCIMIITSVVPPELPMELSLAVTHSLAALSKGLVFCTEPFRIPLAGKLDVLCFDKTGTLTKDKMILKGVVVEPEYVTIDSDPAAAAGTAAAVTTVSRPQACGDTVLAVMGSCHALMQGSGGGLLGDPLEKATVEASGFSFVKESRAAGPADSATLLNPALQTRVRVLRRFPFNSTLKRMSVAVESTVSGSPPSTFIYTKGAPEVLAEHLQIVPAAYKATYLHHMNKGKRVLTIAFRALPDAARIAAASRKDVEAGLTFAGFLIFDCDLKPDSKSVIRDLKNANSRVVMITGDSAYTAADVGKKLGMLRAEQPVLILQPAEAEDKGAVAVWRSVDESSAPLDFDPRQVQSLSETNNLCVAGAALGALMKAHSSAPEPAAAARECSAFMQSLCPYIGVFARVSPAQKEAILLALNDTGVFTLMCGDGTNDVGALKAAHVGVSIVNNPELESRIDGAADPSSKPLGKGEKKPKGQSSRDRMARAVMEYNEQEKDPTIVKLGDASIASPFTARRTSIDCVLTVMRQGRCTLVTSIQVYKVLALNCLVSAYMMSALYLRGLKQGDMQMTASGLVTAGLFFFLSQAKPLANVAAKKPPSSVFAKSVLLSIIGQFAVHLASLMATFVLCSRYLRVDDRYFSPDSKFRPNVINSAVYILSATMQVNNFVINYRGEPFTQSITDNKQLWRSIQGIYLALLVLAGGQFDPLNDLLQMAPFPDPQFQIYLIGILVVNFAASYVIEKSCQRFLE